MRRPCIQTSSPTLTTAVISCSDSPGPTAGSPSAAFTPSRKRAPPTPPTRTVTLTPASLRGVIAPQAHRCEAAFLRDRPRESDSDARRVTSPGSPSGSTSGRTADLRKPDTSTYRTARCRCGAYGASTPQHLASSIGRCRPAPSRPRSGCGSRRRSRRPRRPRPAGRPRPRSTRRCRAPCAAAPARPRRPVPGQVTGALQPVGHRGAREDRPPPSESRRPPGATPSRGSRGSARASAGTRMPSGAGPGAGSPKRRHSSRHERRASVPVTFCSSTRGHQHVPHPHRWRRTGVPGIRRAASATSGWWATNSSGRSCTPSSAGSPSSAHCAPGPHACMTTVPSARRAAGWSRGRPAWCRPARPPTLTGRTPRRVAPAATQRARGHRRGPARKAAATRGRSRRAATSVRRPGRTARRAAAARRRARCACRCRSSQCAPTTARSPTTVS